MKFSENICGRITGIAGAAAIACLLAGAAGASPHHGGPGGGPFGGPSGGPSGGPFGGPSGGPFGGFGGHDGPPQFPGHPGPRGQGPDLCDGEGSPVPFRILRELIGEDCIEVGERPGRRPGGQGESPAPVPLPAAGLLMLGGIGGLGLVARRRRRKED